MKTKNREYLQTKITYHYQDGVIKDDYYKDHLVKQLPQVVQELIDRVKRPLRVLDMATGHGYTAIIMAKHYADQVERVVAYDINPKAVELAKSNAKLNQCGDKIEFRVGSLYEPLEDNETFDLIISALPPIPITSEELARLPHKVQSHHWIKSTGGTTGRDLIDGKIRGSHDRLNNGGVMITVHADFLDNDMTLDLIRALGLKESIVGDLLPVKLKATELTLSRKDHIESMGFTFTKDVDGDDQFFITVFQGIKES